MSLRLHRGITRCFHYSSFPYALNHSPLTPRTILLIHHLTPTHHPHTHLTDISSLLQQLGLEHYQERFEEEELDFETFLTMSESDLKEIGVNTLGARRKIQIAISGGTYIDYSGI